MLLSATFLFASLIPCRRVRGVVWSILGGSGPLDSGSNPDGPIFGEEPTGNYFQPRDNGTRLLSRQGPSKGGPPYLRDPHPRPPLPSAGPWRQGEDVPAAVVPLPNRLGLAPPRSLRTASGPPDRAAEVARQNPEGPHLLRLPGPTNRFQSLSASMTRCSKVQSLLRWQAPGEGTFID